MSKQRQGHYLAVDIGGTKIKGALFYQGKMINKTSIPTLGNMGRDIIFRQLCTLVDSLFEGPLTYIGVSTAGDVDQIHGVINYATDNLMGWTGFDIKKELVNRYRCEVEVENDAICALLGEIGDDRIDNVTMLTFGTGVGGASLVKGKISRLPSTAWGHVSIHLDGPRCPGCHRHNGCSEMYLSGQALKKQIAVIAKRKLDLPQFFDLCKAEEPWAIDILKEFCKNLELLLSKIVIEVHSDIIILGGGMMGSFSIIFPYLSPRFQQICRVAIKGNDAGMIGATMLPFSLL